MSTRSLVCVIALTVGDYLLWNWSLAGGHVTLALIAGFTIPPLAAASALLLAIFLAVAIARSTLGPARHLNPVRHLNPARRLNPARHLNPALRLNPARRLNPSWRLNPARRLGPARRLAPGRRTRASVHPAPPDPTHPHGRPESSRRTPDKLAA